MKKLLCLALVFSLIGLCSLIFLAEYAELERVAVKDLASKVGRRVIISGKVITTDQRSTVNFFELKDQTGQTKVVAFSKIQKIALNSQIIVKGKVSVYKGDLEIIADWIENV
ncbi:exodeoxyribonuclease VII large subunit [Candidatus Woesearchaeota archaeon]|jgi:RecJ-like exonuclease|nr:exodeoxyribonuclease VII large subunit [Candidatus Woesearchaeota archaeon]MBT4114155.1 exodeoxyribonuclease VII large subunit [Candidatus Woesearchaeota archaeon]MBT4248402.1 exodeoxyribonuclease VII large subunit [Candidatus Woesearchaeota archaeon]